MIFGVFPRTCTEIKPIVTETCRLRRQKVVNIKMSAHAVCFKLFIFSLFIFDLKIGRCVADVQHLTKDNFQPFIDSNQFVLVLFSEYFAPASLPFSFCDV